MATPTTNAAWLQHWKDKLYELSEVGQEYSVPGAQSHKLMSAEKIQEQIDLYEGKVLEDDQGYNGRSEVY